MSYGDKTSIDDASMKNIKNLKDKKVRKLNFMSAI